MTDMEKHILRNIDRLSDDCIKYLESEYSTIPNIGLFNIDLIVLSFLMEHLLSERGFHGKRVHNFLDFYQDHFILNRCNAPRKTTIFSLGNDEIDSKNLVAYLKFEQMEHSEKKQYFIRTLSNISPEIDKYIDSTRNYSESSEVYYPFITLVNIYVDPLFCHKTPRDKYHSEIRVFSQDIKNSNIDLPKFLRVFSKMWVKVISKHIDEGSMFLDSIEINFPSDKMERVQVHNNSTKNNSGCLLFLSIIFLTSLFSFFL